MMVYKIWNMNWVGIYMNTKYVVYVSDILQRNVKLYEIFCES